MSKVSSTVISNQKTYYFILIILF